MIHIFFKELTILGRGVKGILKWGIEGALEGAAKRKEAKGGTLLVQLNFFNNNLN